MEVKQQFTKLTRLSLHELMKNHQDFLGKHTHHGGMEYQDPDAMFDAWLLVYGTHRNSFDVNILHSLYPDNNIGFESDRLRNVLGLKKL